jgi:ABC-type phosphate transport system substrate-binding protein
MRALLVIALLLVQPAFADESFVVIVHPKNSASKLDKKVVADGFLKKRTRWGDDKAMQPIDQKKSASVRADFSKRILDRSVASVRTYWNQIVFSGRGVPPPEADSDEAVVTYVANNPGAIGYVGSSTKLDGVKVIPVK